MDGFGSMGYPMAERLATVADTLVYLDMPVWLLHYWWVTKRFLQGAWVLTRWLAGGKPVTQRDAEFLYLPSDCATPN